MVAARLRLGPLRRSRPDVVIDAQNGLPSWRGWRFGSRIWSCWYITATGGNGRWRAGCWGGSGWWVESRLSPRLHRRNQCVTVSLPSATRQC